MVNGPEQVWVERDGRIEPTAARFAGESDLRHAIERILAPLGRRVDEAEPLCDARLPDGSRVNVVVAPLALDGSVLTIRRFRPRGFGPADLVANGDLGAAAARPARERRARALQRPHQRRHRLGQDDDAQRADGVHRRATSGSSPSRTPPSCACATRTSCGSRRGRRRSRAAAR